MLEQIFPCDLLLFFFLLHSLSFLLALFDWAGILNFRFNIIKQIKTYALDLNGYE